MNTGFRCGGSAALRRAAGQIWRLMPGSASMTLSTVDFTFDRLHPHRKADDVRFHRIVGDAFPILRRPTRNELELFLF
jgi:hypothetical protein